MANSTAFIGLGRIGTAILSGVLKSQSLAKGELWAAVKDISVAQIWETALGISVTTRPEKYLEGTKTILLCVEPKDMTYTIQNLISKGAKEGTLWLSVAAGITTERIEKVLCRKDPVVRVMPNTPASVGAGTTVLCRGSTAEDRHICIGKTIFSSVGRCFESEEKYFDLVTALVGSGPAFFYRLVEILAEYGHQKGLDAREAQEIVAQVMQGAGKMINETGKSPAELLQAVSTPGGCTLAGLNKLDELEMTKILEDVIQKTIEVAKNLGK